MSISRRAFFQQTAVSCLLASASTKSWAFLGNSEPKEESVQLSLHEAMFYKKLEQKEIECELCPRKCKVSDLERGYCGVRENKDGRYISLVYSRPCSMNVDPIEKKPFFHFLPGTNAFSLSTAGCNMHCKFCQNWQISQVRPEQVPNSELTPQDLVQMALSRGAKSIAYTYTEPIIYYEYMYDTAVIAKAQKKPKSVMVSAGYICKEPLDKLCKVLDGIKIDLKSFSQKFYQDLCHADLKPVLETLTTIKEEGVWLEIVVLILPTLNDSVQEAREMASWIKENLGPDVPVHYSRFHPMYLLKNLPSTPISTLEKMRETALDVGLNYVYIGNVPGHPAESTYCPSCKKVILKRYGYTILENDIKDGACLHCGVKIPGFWLENSKEDVKT